MTDTPDAAPAAPPASWLPYVAPMVAFLALTMAEGKVAPSLYPPLYAVKALVVAALLAVFSRAWRHELRGDGRAIGIGAAVGLLGLGLWLGLDALQPAAWSLGKRTAFNPLTAIENPALRYGFLAFRFLGLAVLVPVMEEVFWRSFVLRYATDQDRWASLPLGKFSLLALAIMCALFALAHPEWLAALAYAALMAGLLHQTRSLLACIVAHAVTNAALGIYVLTTGNWKYW